MDGIECKVGIENGWCTYEIVGEVTDEEFQGLCLAIGRSRHVAARQVTRPSHILVVIELNEGSLPRDIDQVIRDYFTNILGRSFEFKHDTKYRL